MAYTFVFDLDSTITKAESLPALAQCLGMGEEMQACTASAMQSELPFAPDFTARVALLAPLSVAQAQQVVASLPLFERIVAFIAQHKKSCLIVTGNLDVYIEALLQRLDMQGQCVCSHGVVEHDRLVAVQRVVDKKQVVQALRKDNIIVCIGDGSNDIGMMQVADIGIAFGGAHPVCDALREAADYYFTQEDALCDFLERLA